jgi:hypothetical protein
LWVASTIISASELQAELGGRSLYSQTRRSANDTHGDLGREGRKRQAKRGGWIAPGLYGRDVGMAAVVVSETSPPVPGAGTADDLKQFRPKFRHP